MNTCEGITKKGTKCTKLVKINTKFCYLHLPKVHIDDVLQTAYLPVEVWSYIFKLINDFPKILTPILCSVNRLFNLSMIDYVKPSWFQIIEPRNNYKLTDSVITCLSHCVTSLDLYCNEYISDKGLSSLKNLKNLKLWYNYNITNYGLRSLTNLRSLNLCRNHHITNYGITDLTNLTELDISMNESITNSGISNLINLKFLTYTAPSEDSYITDESISKLTNLEYLKLAKAKYVTDESVSKLTNLQTLNVSYQFGITLNCIHQLTNLTYLNLHHTGIYQHNIDTLKVLGTRPMCVTVSW